MRAVTVSELGAPPEVVDRPEPIPGEDDVTITLEAASLNPVDLAVASGKFYGGHPPMPYVPCIEGVGRLVGDGTRVLAVGAGLGVSRDGTAAERFAAPRAALIDLNDDVDAGLAAALGTAGLAGWLPLSWRAPVQPGETVVVLGATGTVGRIALQAARELGGGRIVAVGRNPERLAAVADLADATVRIDDDFADALARAVDGGADIIFDALWGEPLALALGVANRGCRVVHVGQSAGAVSAVASGFVRGRQMEVLGYSNFAVPTHVVTEAYHRLVELAIAGSLRLDVTPVPFSDIATAWSGVAASTGKFVVVP